MKFENLAFSGKKKPKGSQARPDEVFVALYDIGNVKNTVTVSIRIGGEVMKQLNWQRGEFAMISESSEVEGYIRLEKSGLPGARRLTDPSGLKNDPEAARYYVLASTFSLHEMPNRPMPATKADHTIENGALIVRFPPWFTFVKKPAKIVPKAAPKAQLKVARSA